MAVGVERHRVSVIASCVVVALVLLVVFAQALLPSLAARRVRDRVARYGTVRSVSVSAFPAIELLWGKAGTVDIAAGTLAVPADRIASLLWEARGVANVTLTADAATLTAVPSLAHGLTVHELRVEKRGARVSASATLTRQQLEEALPSGLRVEPTASGGGEVEARASGGLFGVQASIDVLVRPQEGRLVAEPRGFPLASLAAVTLFSDPHLRVDSVAVRVLRRRPLAYGLSLGASLL
jgi:hypothetical protein